MHCQLVLKLERACVVQNTLACHRDRLRALTVLGSDDTVRIGIPRISNCVCGRGDSRTYDSTP